MDGSVEGFKRMNLVEFLSRHYDLIFKRQGTAFACCSPFTAESRPSFFVRLVGAHWLFKDFSSGLGGSVFEFVQIKEELASFSQALAFLRDLLPGFAHCDALDPAERLDNSSGRERSYDVNALYERFACEDPGVCRAYLLSRKIAPALVEGFAQLFDATHLGLDALLPRGIAHAVPPPRY